MTLLDEQDIEILTSLHLWQYSSALGHTHGSYRACLAGDGLEFRQYSLFSPGDDIRRVDWHHYAGKRQLVHKQAELNVRQDYYLLLDLSASMAAGGELKLTRARQLAAALVFIMLKAGSGLVLADLQGRISCKYTNMSHLTEACTFVESLTVSDGVSPAEFPGTVLSARHNDRVVLISDMLCADGFARMAENLNLWPDNITIISLSTPQERQPELAGAVTLVDSETGQELSLDVTPGRIAQYKKAREVYFEQLTHYVMGRCWLYYDVCAGLTPGRMLEKLVINNGIML